MEEARIVSKTHITAGRMLAVDLKEGRFYDEDELVDALADDHPYTEWLKNIVALEDRIGPCPEPRKLDREALTRRQVSAGLSLEDIELILAPLA